MDTNDNKTPRQESREGGKKPFHGKHRPRKHGNRRPDNRDRVSAPEAAKENVAAPISSAEQSPHQQHESRQDNKNRRGHGGRNDRRERIPEESKPLEAQAVVEETDVGEREQPREKGDRSSQRPQRPRNISAPKKPSALPQMNNLLIEDCPEEVADLGNALTDAAELERILNYDMFAKESRVIPDEIPAGKVVIAGVRFRAGGKTYFFSPGQLNCTVGSYAVVETARGLEFGEICIGNRMVDESLVIPPLRPVVRLATPEDLKQNELNHEREAEAFRIGKEKIAEHGLDMKLVSVQYTFDDSKLLFYFTSDGRVDFRELVKDLAGVFHIRIELRQIGIRDEARMLGGLGACGRPLCCSTFLSDFGQVSMKMAKEQNLSLNSTKISGCCGRLMCCLRYEHETYAEALRQLPTPGSFVNTPDGPGIVTDVFPLEDAVKVALRSETATAPKKYNKQEISVQHRGPAPAAVPAEDISEPDSDD